MRDYVSRAAILRFVAVLLTFCPLAASAQGEAIDDVMQHVPMASAFALRVCGVKSESPTWTEFVATAGVSYLVGAGVAYTLKHTVKEWRPDDSDQRSFPSGHATFAFAGATALRHEHGHLSPWVTIGGYGLATLVAAVRVRRDRHYTHDVCAGAAIGWLSTELTYYIKKKYIKSDRVDVAFTGQSLSLAIRW
jgi:membrane-associated phospholipid phosphatase